MDMSAFVTGKEFPAVSPKKKVVEDKKQKSWKMLKVNIGGPGE